MFYSRPQALGVPPITPAVERRFWSKVDKTSGHGPDGDCWLWTASLDAKTGYPRGLVIDKGNYRASHIALTLDGRARPDGDMHALHSCDNKRCVRASHLRWGTTQDNAQDHLERREPSKRWLSDDVVREIRMSTERGVDIARRFGITSAAVCNIRKRVSHKHVA